MFDTELFKEMFARERFFLIAGESSAVVGLVREAHEAIFGLRERSVHILQQLPDDYRESSAAIKNSLAPEVAGWINNPRAFLTELLRRFPTDTIVITNVERRSAPLQHVLTEAVGGDLRDESGALIPFDGKLVLTTADNRSVLEALSSRLVYFFLPAGADRTPIFDDGLHDRPGGCIEIRDDL